MTLRLVICGQRSFGAAVVDLAAARPDVEVALVVAPPWRDADLPAWADTAGTDRTWAAAARHGFPLADSATFTAGRVPAGVDLIVAAHSHNFVSRSALARTRLGGVGYHPSLLPRHRGRDAVRWTVRMRDPVAGGTVYWLTDNVDGGPVAAQDWCWVRPEDTHRTLWQRELFPLGVRLLAAVLDDLTGGAMVQEAQDERVATWEPSWSREPLHRPDLPEIGAGPAGYRVVAGPGAARRGG